MGTPGIRVNRFSLCHAIHALSALNMRKDSYRYIFWSSCAAILEIFYTYGLYEDIGAFINKNTANVEEYLDSKAQTRAPEDPEHPDRPITSQIKNDKRGRRRMIKETKEQGEKKKKTLVEPTETFTSTK